MQLYGPLQANSSAAPKWRLVKVSFSQCAMKALPPAAILFPQAVGESSPQSRKLTGRLLCLFGKPSSLFLLSLASLFSFAITLLMNSTFQKLKAIGKHLQETSIP